MECVEFLSRSLSDGRHLVCGSDSPFGKFLTVAYNVLVLCQIQARNG